MLGRYLRSVVVLDILRNRNYNIHGYLGFENTPVTNAIQKSWQDVSRYPSVHQVRKEVNRVRKDSDNDLFLISVTPSTNESNNEKDTEIAINKEFKSRYLIIATGVDQIKPEIKNFHKFLGNGIWHCPHCDGFATTDKKLIIIATHDDPHKAIRYAKVFLGWTNDITLFLDK